MNILKDTTHLYAVMIEQMDYIFVSFFYKLLMNYIQANSVNCNALALNSHVRYIHDNVCARLGKVWSLKIWNTFFNMM